MALVPGASRYLNQATLPMKQGSTFVAPSVLELSGASDTAGLLSAGRAALSVRGIGLSSSARAINTAFFSNTALINEMLSLTAGPDATIEGAQQQILAMRAGMSDSQLARDLREPEPTPKIAVDDEQTSPSLLGSELDTEA